MRQAGRYMAEYRAIRKHHSLVEICKQPALAAEVTITAAEYHALDAAIIFADLLLPLETMGLGFRFAAGEGPVIDAPLRSPEQIDALRVDRAADLNYVCDAIKICCKHWGDKRPMIGFCGAPFTLASYMIEGGGSRHYVEVKRMMRDDAQAFDALLEKLVAVLGEFARAQIAAGADVIQLFDSWVGCLSPDEYRQYVLPRTRALIAEIQQAGAPVIYFGVDTATLLGDMSATGADAVGLDWRTPIDFGWSAIGDKAMQGNLDPTLLFSPWPVIEAAAEKILQAVGSRPGHIFNLGHGILPHTPVENVKRLAEFVQSRSAELRSAR